MAIKKLRVLSLFDGISCARQAIAELGWDCEYYASEVDKYAIQITQRNWPQTHQLGDITQLNTRGEWAEGSFDLLIGGSPCQDLSIAKQGREGLKGKRSGLFFEYLRLLHQLKPKYYILENVASMSKESRDEITKLMGGVEPIMINAALVSAQNRKRLFWTNIPGITQPEDRGIFLKDIILDGDTEDLKSLCITATYASKNKQDFLTKRMGQMIQIGNIGSNSQAHRVYDPAGKSVALSAGGGGQGGKTGLYMMPVALTESRTEEAKQIRREARKEGRDFSPRRAKELVPRKDGKANTITTGQTKEGMIVVPVAMRNRGEGKKPEYNKTGKANSITTVQTDSMVEQGFMLRKLHPIECERLQSLPDGYTEYGRVEVGEDEPFYQAVKISNTQRYRALGNAFNVEVIKHILSHI